GVARVAGPGRSRTGPTRAASSSLCEDEAAGAPLVRSPRNGARRTDWVAAPLPGICALVVSSALSFCSHPLLYHPRDRQGVFVAPLLQGLDNIPPALDRVVLVHLPLTLNLLDLDTQADNLCEATLRKRR